MCGITPVWASEVEPYPITVTRSRFPDMKHLGDISKLNGAEIEPVDVITFGSPCQDLSVAGKRAGMKHEAHGDKETTRSGLFMEAVRIIKEMREATNGQYPTFAVWENVPGAFSSNKGEDFRSVLEELIKIAEPAAVMPAVPKKGWAYADHCSGDGWSLAYRVLDAQHWGVPQRRRRIYLVLDLGGQRAGQISFERKGLRGYFTKGRAPWKRFAASAESSAGAEDYGSIIIDSIGGQAERAWEGKVAPTLKATHYKTPPCVTQAAGFCTEHSAKARGIGYQEEASPTLRAGVTPAVVYDARGNGNGQTVPTLTGDHENRVTDYTAVAVEPVICLQGNTIDRNAGQNGAGVSEGTSYSLTAIDRHGVAYCMAHGQANAEICEEKCPTLNCNHEQPIVFDKEVYNSGANTKGGHYISEDGPAPTLRGTGHPPGVCNQYIIRRLTPMECARLQGFPDTWGNP